MMSELTPCNRCSLNRMIAEAAKRGAWVILGKDEYGWVTATTRIKRIKMNRVLTSCNSRKSVSAKELLTSIRHRVGKGLPQSIHRYQKANTVLRGQIDPLAL